MSSFRSPKSGSHKEKDLGCTEDVEVFPSQIPEDYPSPDWQYGHRRYHGKGWFRLTAFQGVLSLLRVFQHPRNKPHLSALLCLPPFPMPDEHTLQYAHLQSNKEKTVWTCAFSPDYVTTVLSPFATNVFYGGRSVFIWLLLIDALRLKLNMFHLIHDF